MTFCLKPVAMESGLQNTPTPQPLIINNTVPTKANHFSDIVSWPHIQNCVFCERAWQWGYPLLLVLGLVGNALCIVAFAGPNLRPKTRALCCVLCALDSLALIVAFASRCVTLFTTSSIRSLRCMVRIIL